jgi:hypothetical protein
MDITYLKECLQKRIELKSLYPKLIGRHNYFDENIDKLMEGIKLVTKIDKLDQPDKEHLYNLGKEFIIIRDDEIQFHKSRISTLFGNVIHDCETELYSVALDVFQTYGSPANISSK